MASDTIAVLPLPEVSDEVRAFAQEMGVSAYLPGIVQATRDVFPQREILIRVEAEPDRATNAEIMLNVDVDGMSASEIRALERRWVAEFFQNCPIPHAHFFCLSLGIPDCPPRSTRSFPPRPWAVARSQANAQHLAGPTKWRTIIPADPETVLPLPEVSDEVRAFAQEKGVSAYLPGVVQMARVIFPQEKIIIRVENDPELSYNTQIVVNVGGECMSSSEMFALHLRWTGELMRNCPTTHAHVFCLCLGIPV